MSVPIIVFAYSKDGEERFQAHDSVEHNLKEQKLYGLQIQQD